MIPPPGPSIPRWAWAFAVCLLAAWNTFLAQYASPLSQTQAYDGAQYQLLARNRLAGSYHVGDQAHTVRDEGSHPMWRPGLVWLTEGLARITGSVSVAAWILSAAATTLMDVTLLWLGWRCFGRAAWIVLLAAMCLPFHWNAIFLSLAVGQGPEPWAALLVLAGWALFLKGFDYRSLSIALAAGIVLGGADWFRTGNLLLFAAPWTIFMAAALIRRTRSEVGECLATLAGFAAMTFLGGLLVCSPVNKTVANLWGNLIEHHGPQLVQHTDSGPQLNYLGGLLLAPGTQETYYDYMVRVSGSSAGAEFWTDKRGEIVPLYFERLGETITGGFSGLRLLAGEWTFAFAVLAIAFAFIRREAWTLAFAAGFFAHYLGPVALFRGDKPTHYLFVVLPMVVLLAGGGAAAVMRVILSKLPAESRLKLVAAGGCILIIPTTLLAISFYRGCIEVMREEHQSASRDYDDLDSLNLQGKRIATRSMAWFADRDVQTILCPYVRVNELEQYALHQGLDGILLRSRDKHTLFNAMPYNSFQDFERAMSQSEVFGCARTAGVWKWFPVRNPSRAP